MNTIMFKTAINFEEDKMKRLFLKSIVIFGILFSSLAMAENFPTREPMGGEPFGHSVKNISDGVYVFRWWVYRNIFVVADEGGNVSVWDISKLTSQTGYIEFSEFNCFLYHCPNFVFAV